MNQKLSDNFYHSDTSRDRTMILTTASIGRLCSILSFECISSSFTFCTEPEQSEEDASVSDEVGDEEKDILRLGKLSE